MPPLWISLVLAVFVPGGFLVLAVGAARELARRRRERLDLSDRLPRLRDLVGRR